MRHVFLLAAVGLLMAACASPDPSGDGPGPAVRWARPGDGNGTTAADAGPSLASWTTYRIFSFDPTAVDLAASDEPKIYEIVGYLKDNPSLDVGIDQTDDMLANRRAAALRRALMEAGGGIASYKIFAGPFADPATRRVGKIQVLVGPRTGSL